jgi:hypothetical protein
VDQESRRFVDHDDLLVPVDDGDLREIDVSF